MTLEDIVANLQGKIAFQRICLGDDFAGDDEIVADIRSYDLGMYEAYKKALELVKKLYEGD